MNYKYNRKKVRLYLQNQQHNCVYCNCKLSFDDNSSLNFATIEHIVPQSRNGSQNIENLTLACPMCNSLRSNQDNFIGYSLNNDQSYFSNKEDLNKTLQYINLKQNHQILNNILILINSGQIESLNDFLNSHKQYKFIIHILNLLTDYSKKIFHKIRKFIENLMATTDNQSKSLESIIKHYEIELIEFSIFDYGLVKQKFSI